jgi:hypothetical protein
MLKKDCGKSNFPQSFFSCVWPVVFLIKKLDYSVEETARHKWARDDEGGSSHHEYAFALLKWDGYNKVHHMAG